MLESTSDSLTGTPQVYIVVLSFFIYFRLFVITTMNTTCLLFLLENS